MWLVPEEEWKKLHENQMHIFKRLYAGKINCYRLGKTHANVMKIWNFLNWKIFMPIPEHVLNCHSLIYRNSEMEESIFNLLRAFLDVFAKGK